LGRRLAYAHDDLREALADRAMMIDASKAEVLEGPGAQRLEQSGLSSGGIDLAPRNRLDQGLELSWSHRMRSGPVSLTFFGPISNINDCADSVSVVRHTPAWWSAG